jgi:hypothetical protein
MSFNPSETVITVSEALLATFMLKRQYFLCGASTLRQAQPPRFAGSILQIEPQYFQIFSLQHSQRQFLSALCWPMTSANLPDKAHTVCVQDWIQHTQSSGAGMPHFQLLWGNWFLSRNGTSHLFQKVLKGCVPLR